MSDATDVYEWTVRIRVDCNALGGSFAVVIFLLSPEEARQDNASSLIPNEPSQWPESPYYIGQISAVPTSTTPTQHGEEAQIIQGFVNLDDELAEKLGRSDVESVLPYLKRALYWKATQPQVIGTQSEDEEFDIDQLPSLEVAVLSSKMKEQSGLLPEFENPVVHPEITAGKRGGLQA